MKDTALLRGDGIQLYSGEEIQLFSSEEIQLFSGEEIQFFFVVMVSMMVGWNEARQYHRFLRKAVTLPFQSLKERNTTVMYNILTSAVCHASGPARVNRASPSPYP